MANSKIPITSFFSRATEKGILLNIRTHPVPKVQITIKANPYVSTFLMIESLFFRS